MGVERRGEPVGVEEFIEIQRFLAEEAALLDRRTYGEWFGLLTDDIVYRVTAQLVRQMEDGPMDYAIVDEDADSLKLRVDQLANPKLTRAENPPSLNRRFISNIRASHGDDPDTYLVESNLLVYKNRTTTSDVGFYVGERRDVLRRIAGRLRIAARLVRLDQSTLTGGTLSTLL